MPEYPEHDRQAKVVDQAQAIGDFLTENTQGYMLGEWFKPEGYHEARLFPVSKPVQQILADYFQIDLDKIEAEKRQMIAAMQAMNGDS